MSYTQIGGGFARIDGTCPCNMSQNISISIVIVGAGLMFVNIIAGIVIIGCGVLAFIGSTIYRYCC